MSLEYDLDTRVGYMPHITHLLTPPVLRRIIDPEAPPKKEPPRNPPRKVKDVNRDYCESCREGGALICCDYCPASYHLDCHDPPVANDYPDGTWQCSFCVLFNGPQETKKESSSSEAVSDGVKMTPVDLPLKIKEEPGAVKKNAVRVAKKPSRAKDAVPASSAQSHEDDRDALNSSRSQSKEKNLQNEKKDTKQENLQLMQQVASVFSAAHEEPADFNLQKIFERRKQSSELSDLKRKTKNRKTKRKNEKIIPKKKKHFTDIASVSKRISESCEVSCPYLLHDGCFGSCCRSPKITNCILKVKLEKILKKHRTKRGKKH